MDFQQGGPIGATGLSKIGLKSGRATQQTRPTRQLVGDRCFNKLGETGTQQAGKTLYSQFLGMTVVGKTIHCGVETKLTNTVLPHSPIQHFQGWQLVSGDDAAFMLHQPAQEGL